VRELRNVIERIVLLESDDEIRPEHLPSEIVRPPSLVAARRARGRGRFVLVAGVDGLRAAPRSGSRPA
jgi:DNA-binding NtrC family response regulator